MSLEHSGQSQVTVSMVGDDIILPCHIEPAVDASDLTVEWARPDLDPRFVHLRRDSVELLPEKNPLYRGRTSLSINKLKCGDVSLKLSKVKLSDEGSYRCFIPTFGTQSVVELAVGSVSSPEIEISKVSSEVMLECKSKGWYPQPEVSWLDAEGKRLSAGPTETFRGPDGLYTVSRRVTVEKRHSNTFTCRVQQKTINQTRETHVHVPETSKNRNELLVEKETHRLAENEKIKYLEKAKGNLDEELQKNERESEYVKEMITKLMRQKENLKNQREKLISLLQEDKTQIKEIKKKLKKKGY
ncbi:butyrophilin subfamily 1 member A1-like [Chaetodon trifascialis]|uniref:butyrophilin subfamily 1 member A1-like n=1 Tax=Chaetodon trifascialis TaxID=109706 RepID=UPI003991838E